VTILELALAVAESGYPVFPTADKIPVWSNQKLGLDVGSGGFKIATRDPEEVTRLFKHPRATEIAVPTGKVSNLLCVDADTYKPGGQRWVTQHRDLLRGARIHTTRSGGTHYLFAHPEGASFPDKADPAVDIKSDGGFICWPGTPGYQCLVDIAPTAPSPKLVALLSNKGPASNMPKSTTAAETENLEQQIISASSLYPSLRSLSLSLANFAVPYGDIQTYLRKLMDQSVAANPGHPRHRDWLVRRKAIPQLVASAVRKTSIDALSTPSKGTWESPHVEDDLPPPIITVDASNDADCDTPPIEWVLPGVLPKGSTCGLAGASSVGKTRWLTALAVTAATGDYPLLGFDISAEPTPVLWIANEERASDLLRRIRAFARAHGVEEWCKIRIAGKENGGVKIARTKYQNVQLVQSRLDEIADLVKDSGSFLLILDPYVSLATGVNENSAESVSVLRDAFNYLTQETDAIIVFAHHTPKRDTTKKPHWYSGMETAFRGSSDIYAQLDVGFTLAPWFPPADDEEASDRWQKEYRSSQLSRFIELVPVKMREGILPQPVVYEIASQQVGAGDSIGYCRLSSPEAALAALDTHAGNDLFLFTVGGALLDRLGPGVHSGASLIYDAIKDVPGVPAASMTSNGYIRVQRGVAKLFGELQTPVFVRRHEIFLQPNEGVWNLHIRKT